MDLLRLNYDQYVQWHLEDGVDYGPDDADSVLHAEPLPEVTLNLLVLHQIQLHAFECGYGVEDCHYHTNCRNLRSCPPGDFV